MIDVTVPVVAVVVAAGSGSRLGAAVPKALVELVGVTLVRRSVDAMVAGGVQQVVVTIPSGLHTQFESALAGVAVPVSLVTGGATRQESVSIGLAALETSDQAIVLVHDAARALIPSAVVRSVIEAVAQGAEAVVPVVPVIDSVRQLADEGSTAVERAALRAVQTPQGARLGVLRSVHEAVRQANVDVTDDASACEYAGHRVELVAGSREAFKITEPIDLLLAEAMLAERARS